MKNDAMGTHARSGIVLFNVKASDGRMVRLHELWFHEHIIQRKIEMGWLTEPVEEIKRALVEATEVRWQPEYQRPLYIGPFIGHGFLSNTRLHVSVEPEKNHQGVIITVVLT
jgi:hypothetical protein